MRWRAGSDDIRESHGLLHETSCPAPLAGPAPSPAWAKSFDRPPLTRTAARVGKFKYPGQTPSAARKMALPKLHWMLRCMSSEMARSRKILRCSDFFRCWGCSGRAWRSSVSSALDPAADLGWVWASMTGQLSVNRQPAAQASGFYPMPVELQQGKGSRSCVQTHLIRS